MIDYNNPYIASNRQNNSATNFLTRLTSFGIVLAFIVIMLGAYTRLTNAGLGCPDWPGCYGQLVVQAQNLVDFNSTKAWTEMIHRYLAGTLGLVVFLAVFTTFYRNIFVYKTYRLKSYLIPALLLTSIIFQALLGMWTVTLKLLPVVVMGHLIGGFITICLLVLLLLSNLQFKNKTQFTPKLKFLCALALIAVFTQILLGGWTSANYAAVPCIDFPACNGQFLPAKDTLVAMNPFYQIGPKYANYEGGVLTNSLRITIQLFHRWGAFITALVLILTACKLSKVDNQYYKKFANWVLFLLVLQLCLGVINVKLALPLFNAVMHNITACLLLISLVVLNYKINLKKA